MDEDYEMPAEEALRDENNEVIISKSRKVVALTKSIFIALVIFLFFFSVGQTLLILQNQEKVADRILDCTVPSGQCYKVKVSDQQRQQAVTILAVVEYCSNLKPPTIEEMEDCITKEMSKR